MAIKLYREYRLKFYLNARHFVIFNGKRGEVHPHTWEYALNIRLGRDSFVEFNVFEKAISSYLEQYQNQTVNDIDPFNSIMPTLENMVDYFGEQFYRIVHDMGGMLMRIEASETPTRSYILDMSEDDGNRELAEEQQKNMLSNIIDEVLDEIIT